MFFIDDTDVPFEASSFKVSSAALVPRLFRLARKLTRRNRKSGIREQSSAMERSFVRFAAFITKYVKNGVDLAFVRTGNKYPQITSAQELIDKFNEEQVSNGYRTTLTTYLDQYLSEYMPRYQNSRKQKCLNLVVLTSNRLYADDFEKIVTHYAKQFNEMSATIHMLGIQFVIIHRGGGLEQHFQRVKRLNDKNDVR